MVDTEATYLDLRKDIKDRAKKAIESCKITGITSLKGLVELALEEFLNNHKCDGDEPGR
jgi:hypothetical protein